MSRARSLTLMATLVGSLVAPPLSHAQLPSSGQYSLTQSSSLVAFTIYTQGLFRLKREGRFKEVAGELSYDPDRPADTRVNLVVNTASVDINNAEHNELLRSPEFFDAAEFPTMRFTSTATATQPDGTMVVDGDLTIRGITKRIAILVALRMTQRDGASAAARFDTTFTSTGRSSASTACRRRRASTFRSRSECRFMSPSPRRCGHRARRSRSTAG